MTIDAWLRAAAARLNSESARLDAELLLTHLLGISRAALYARLRDTLAEDIVASADALLARRARGEPIAYITGVREFWFLPLKITSAVLVPRAETEVLVEQALARLPTDRDLRLLDLGTGSGAIALALAKERPRALVHAVDASAAALAIAQENAERLGLGNVRCALGDWFRALPDAPERALPPGLRFDLIAANPPYVAGDDPHLLQGDLRYEPRLALTPEGDGLSAIRRISADARAHLQAGGWLLLEHGHDQGAAVRQILSRDAYANIETIPDMEDRDRVTLGRWQG
ncbi:MAG: peptide chain release factor N(5)-glutamine methyltransferase [Xanthomonadales bacterium]|nr:peptide chain release factor N(5)-glutamine methyltransferase [Xanthomonadales bacterium]